MATFSRRCVCMTHPLGLVPGAGPVCYARRRCMPLHTEHAHAELQRPSLRAPREARLRHVTVRKHTPTQRGPCTALRRRPRAGMARVPRDSTRGWGRGRGRDSTQKAQHASRRRDGNVLKAVCVHDVPEQQMATRVRCPRPRTRLAAAGDRGRLWAWFLAPPKSRGGESVCARWGFCTRNGDQTAQDGGARCAQDEKCKSRSGTPAHCGAGPHDDGILQFCVRVRVWVCSGMQRLRA